MRRGRTLSISLGLVVLLGFVTAPGAGGEAEKLKSVFTHFVTRQADKLFDGPRELRFVSFNIPNLHYVEDDMRFDRPCPFRLPDEFEIIDSLESIRRSGGLVVRTYTLPVRRGDDADNIPVYVEGPGRFNEEAFRALDMVLAQANRLGVRLIIPLVDEHKWWGGRGEYAAFRGKSKDAFWTDPQLIADFKKTIDYVVNRTNSITGVRYRDDKAILAWETGNELESPPKWTRQIAAYLKQVDPNHLVVDGRNASTLHPESVLDPNVDLVTTHHYATDVRETLRAVRASRAMSKGKKAYFVGEFGFLPTSELAALLDTAMDGGAAGALIWSLRCHNRDGGFHWHSEPMVQGRYKAYHWPGFASGDAYDERGVLALMRTEAFAAGGRPEPPAEVPQPPMLLPIPHVAAISWRGSAGATCYDVQRSPRAEGRPWITVGRDVSDASVAYRPLFHDAAAEVGQQYYYRVVAKKDWAGDSAPSNVVGPVRVDALWLIDELGDFATIAARHGKLTLVTKQARQAKEDMNRLAGSRGDWIVYRTDEPIAGVTVFAFFPNDVANPRFFSSPDGERYTEASADHCNHFSGAGAYGYFKPVEYRVTTLSPTARYLKIELAGKTELARVEIRYGAQHP